MMAGWQILGLEGEPVPGNPQRVGELGTRLRKLANAVDDGQRRAGKIANNEGSMQMRGDFAPKFKEALDGLPREMIKLREAYRNCGKTLSTYSTELDWAKRRAGSALRAGTDADRRYTAAISRMRSQLPLDKQGPLAGGNPRPRYSDVDRHVKRLEDDIKGRVMPDLRQAFAASGDLESAKRQAASSRSDRNAAVRRCEKGIRDALANSGIKNTFSPKIASAANLSGLFDGMDINWDQVLAVGEILVGLALIMLGADTFGGGVVLDGTGVGAVVGVPLNLAGVALVGVGTGLVGKGLADSAPATQSSSSGGGGDSGDTGGSSGKGNPKEADEPHGKYLKEGDKHGPESRQEGGKTIGKEPEDGQEALNNSVSYSENSPHRVGIDKKNEEIVVLDETHPGQQVYHGHVRTFDQLTDKQQNALKRAGLVTSRGKIKK